MAPAGLGTDTGGSVRIPAALNGIAGLRPTVGRYPQDGIVPISSTRDTAGPKARTVDDLVLLDGVITEAPLTIEPAAIGEVRLGVPAGFNDNVSMEVAAARDAALARLEAAGATLVPLEMTGVFDLNDKVGFPVALTEVARDLPAFLERWETGVGLDEVVEKLASPDVVGVFQTFVVGDEKMPEEAYRAAIETFRPRLQALYAETFARHKLDAIVFPTTPLPAPPIEGADETVVLNGAEVPTFQTYIRNTDPGSNAGLPGLTLPIGLDSLGLPIGLALDGPAFSDRNLLAVGLAAEAVLGPIPPPVQ
jgi:mandelamide amidase